MLSDAGWLKRIFYPFYSQNDQKSEPSFTPSQKELYDTIVTSLKFYANPRLDHPVLSRNGGKEHECLITFYHTKSWKFISDKLLNDIESNDLNVNHWIKEWRVRIHKFRDNQALIRSTYEKRDRFEQIRLNTFMECARLEVAKNSATATKTKINAKKNRNRLKRIELKGIERKLSQLDEEIRSLSKRITAFLNPKIDSYNDTIEEAKQRIQDLVSNGLQNLHHVSPEVTTACSKVIQYMLDNWTALTEFSRNELVTIDVDEEKIRAVVSVTTPQNISLKRTINNARPAIYIFRQKISKSLVTDIKGEPYHLISPTHLMIKDKYLLGEEPAASYEKEILSQEEIYDMSFSKNARTQSSAKILPESEETVNTIEMIIQTALNTVNDELLDAK